MSAWEALSRIFTSILEDLQHTYLVIDALDECSTDLALLPDIITQKLLAYPHVEWIVSSRNWVDIAECLDNAAQKWVLSLDLNEKPVSQAVTVNLHHKGSGIDRVEEI